MYGKLTWLDKSASYKRGQNTESQTLDYNIVTRHSVGEEGRAWKNYTFIFNIKSFVTNSSLRVKL